MIDLGGAGEVTFIFSIVLLLDWGAGHANHTRHRESVGCQLLRNMLYIIPRSWAIKVTPMFEVMSYWVTRLSLRGAV
jgi:hypothetical protein